MNIYLAIITTVLVVTQIERIVQNTLSLRKQNKLIDKQLNDISEITNEDIERQRRVYDALIKHFKEEEE